MTINGDSTTGKFDDVAPIPVTFNVEHVLSVTIDFGDMKFTYLQKEDKFDESCFDGTNNKVTVNNNSTCDIFSQLLLNIDTETYSCLEEPDFRLTINNTNADSEHGYLDVSDMLFSNDSPFYEPHIVYLSVVNTDSLASMHNYNFNDAKIGEITVKLDSYL